MAKPKLRDGAYDNSPRAPMEVLAMLAGKSSYVVPTEGKSTSTTRLEPSDVSTSLSAAPDEFGKEMALTITCIHSRRYREFMELGENRIRAHLHQQTDHAVHFPRDNMFRSRLVMKDVFEDLLFPQRRLPYSSAALTYAMRTSTYRWLHHHIYSYTNDRANEAARAACRYLFAPDRPPPSRDSPPDENRAAQAVACMRARTVADHKKLDVMAMIEDWRPITPGLLTLDSVLARAANRE